MRNAPFLFSKQRQAANVPSTRRGDCYGRRCGVFSRKAPRTPNNRHSGCFILCFAEDSVRRRQNIPFNSQSLRDCRDFSGPPLSATKKHPACTGRFLWRREGDSELSRASCAALIAARLRGFLLFSATKKHPACTGRFFMAERGRFELPVGDYPNTRFPVVRLRPAQPSLQHDYIIILLFLPFVKGFPGEKSVFLNVSRRYL